MSTPSGPRPRESILEIAPYVPGKSKATGGRTLHKLSSNETPLGASPKAIEAYRIGAEELERYPDGASTALRQAIGEVYGLSPDHIVCGAGSDELLSLLAYAYVGPGDEVIHSQHGFLVYPIAAMAAGGTPVVARESDLIADVDAILAAVTDRTKLVFLANPNNPTGTYLPFDEIKRLHAGLPDNVLLVLDAAYAEYVRRNDYESGIELAATSKNVVMTRTFSKIYGLAFLRLGWCYGPAPIIDVINRIRGPFNVNGPAIAAGIEAIRDRAFVDQAFAHNEKWLPWVTEALTDIGLKVTPSVCNFIHVDFPENGGKTAAAADAFLLDRGLILRRLDNYGLPSGLRMTIGSEDANRDVVAALKEFMS